MLWASSDNIGGHRALACDPYEDALWSRSGQLTLLSQAGVFGLSSAFETMGFAHTRLAHTTQAGMICV